MKHSRSSPRRWLVEPGVLALAACFLLLFPLLFKPWIHGADTIGYFSWLRSVVIDRNLQTADEFEHFGMGWLNSFTETGMRDNPGAVGSALLWAPWFVAVHGVTLAGRALGMDWAADGYGQQYIVAASLASATYAFAGLLLTYRVACDFFSQRLASLSLAAVWLSSPVVFYMYSHPLMSHANDAFAYGLLLYVWHRTRSSHSSVRHVWMGLAAGLCALVRNQNAILVVFPLAEIAYDSVRLERHDGCSGALWQGILKGARFSLAWWLAFLPQLIVWRVVFGTWLPGNPYASSGGGTFDYLRPQILGVLLSTNRGLFIWNPLVLVSVLGWYPLWRTDRRLSLMVSVNFVLQLYIIASWSSWGGSAAFGQRFFANMVPAFALGLAAILTHLRPRIAFGWLIVVCGLFVIWNGLLIVRYALEDVPRIGPLPLRDLIAGQFTVIPRRLERLIQVLLRRE